MAKEEDNKLSMEVEVTIKEDLWEKIEAITDAVDTEWGCFLTGSVGEDGIDIDDILIPTQEVSGGDVDIKEEDLVKLRKEYGDRCANIIGHLHSHCNMTPFWSQTDISNMEKLTSGRDVRVFIVTSKSNGSKTAIWGTKPFGFKLDNVPLSIISDRVEKLKESLKKEIEGKIKKAKVETSVTYYNGGGGYYNDRSRISKPKIIVTYDDETDTLIMKNCSWVQKEALCKFYGIPVAEYTAIYNAACYSTLYTIDKKDIGWRGKNEKKAAKLLDSAIAEINKILQDVPNEGSQSSRDSYTNFGDRKRWPGYGYD